MNYTRRFIQLLGIQLLTIIMAAAPGLYFGVPGYLWNSPATTAQAEDHKYSCSMHPEIISAKAGNCPKYGMLLVLDSLQVGHESCDHSGQNQASCCTEIRAPVSTTNLLLPPGHPPVPGWTVHGTPQAENASTKIPAYSSH